MKQILKNFKTKDALFVIVSIGLIILQVFLELKLPRYMTEISTLIVTPGTSSAIIWEKGAIMLLCSLGSLASAIIVGFFISNIHFYLTWLQ